MANSKPPSNGWVVEDDPFIEVYNELRKVLAILGMRFPNRHRFDCFKLYTKLRREREELIKENQDSPLTNPLVETYEQALYLVEEMTQMKIHGMEPEHLNGKYV
jgi:hypothetical protein